MIRNVLKSNTLTVAGSVRMQEAASVPFRSLQTGLDSNPDDGTIADFQDGLKEIMLRSNQLPKKHLPVQRATNEPPRIWGPFVFSPFEDGKFQETTFFAVKRFQEQAGLKVDGKAGIKTLGRLDEILVFLEDLPFIIER
jgi:hypothetical protein